MPSSTSTKLPYEAQTAHEKVRTYCIAGNFHGAKFSQMAPKMNFTDTFLWMLAYHAERENTIVPNSRILFLWMLDQLRNLRKFPAILYGS